MHLSDNLASLKGVGPKTANLFQKLDIYTIEDLLQYFPRDYYQLSDLVNIEECVEEKEVAIYASLTRPLSVQFIKRLQVVRSSLEDTTGEINVCWYNMPYLKNTIKTGCPYVFVGKVVNKRKQLLLEQPAIYPLEKYQSMRKSYIPIYALTKGITNTMISKLQKQALEELPLLRDPLPDDIREQNHLAEYRYALEQIHFPEDEHHLTLARKRLVFQEFFLFILAIQRYKEKQTNSANSFLVLNSDTTETVLKNLGYQLTGAQIRCWKDICYDLKSDKIMARLIQGDVGSGKTIIAFLSMLLMAENHYQSVLMVPTEVLARQHYESMVKLIEQHQLPYHAALLTGSMTARQKRDIYDNISQHKTDFIIGTHAVIQEKVSYSKLGLVITDEQHRFGVKQRETLSQKGTEPHTMVMSATPIPRTLAVILYGDLDISIIDELPSNRIPIKNCVVNTSYRKKAYEFIENQVRLGHQAYIICPMVEESEMIEAEDVLSYTEKLKQALPPEINISALHGKMKAKEKNAIMEMFLNNEIQVLVSTTVVEVGVNVPNATVMMIENAERFGLAQLHQLRGRVGRGSDQSYCIMIAGSDGAEKKKRLEILNKSNDGFYIAEEDLKLRGPGDLLGVRQSGDMEFRIGDIYSDSALLGTASTSVQTLLKNDPDLTLTKHLELRKFLEGYMEQHISNLNL